MKRIPLQWYLFPLILLFLPILILLPASGPCAAAGDETLSPLPDGVAGEAGFVALLLQSMDPLAVIVAIALTQLLKLFLPGPFTGERSLETVQGSVYNRILPFVPVLIGLAVVFLHFRSQPFGKNLVQGIVSGIAAAYFYRAWKVTIFGS